MITRTNRLDFFAISAFLVPLIIYSLTLCRGIFVGDSAELALAAVRLQIAHPPGYPLLTLLGNLWAGHIEIVRPILALNFLSAILAAAAALMLFVILRSLVEAEKAGAQFVALLVAIAFACTRTLWSVATNFEVYSLSAFLSLAALWGILRLYRSADRRAFYLAAFVFGLGLCNHLSILALTPGLLILLWFSRDSLMRRDFLIAGVLFVIAASCYLYLPLRAGEELILSWYNPQSWIGFQQQVFAESYQRFLARPELADLAPFFVRLWRQLSVEFALPVIILALIGLALQIHSDRKLAVALISVVVLNLALNLSYTIADIAPYFLLTILTCCLWLGELCFALYRRPRLAVAGVVLALGLAAVALFGNWSVCNIRSRDKSEVYSRDLFARVPPGGLLLCGSDNSMFPSLYLRYVENYRPDCEVSGHLPTLSHLRRLLNYNNPNGWTHFRNLLDFAIDSTNRPVIMARELMNFDNDYSRLRNDLIAGDLVYVADSSLLPVISNRQLSVALGKLPANLDPKEAALYAVYHLAEAGQQDSFNVANAKSLYERAARLVLSTAEPSMISALAAHLINVDQLRLARELLETVVANPTVRRSEKLQLLSGLGHVTLRLDDRAAATAIFEKILILDEANIEARFQVTAIKAAAAVESQDISLAIALYEELHVLAPDHAPVNFQLGALYAQSGNSAAAVEAFRRCLSANYRVEEVAAIVDQLENIGAP